jgi:hypothetical protein
MHATTQTHSPVAFSVRKCKRRGKKVQLGQSGLSEKKQSTLPLRSPTSLLSPPPLSYSKLERETMARTDKEPKVLQPIRHALKFIGYSSTLFHARPLLTCSLLTAKLIIVQLDKPLLNEVGYERKSLLSFITNNKWNSVMHEQKFREQNALDLALANWQTLYVIISYYIIELRIRTGSQ